MAKINKLNLLGEFLLLFATVAWGTSFFILKDTIEKVPTFYVLAIRFLLSSIVLALVFIKKLKKANKKLLLQGAFLGVLLTCAYVFQTIGLKYTTPSRNAFITASYVIMTPFLYWIIAKCVPKSYSVVSAVLCIIGIGFISFTGNGENGANNFLGDTLTFISAIFYALQIIFIGKFQSKNSDTGSLLVIELSTVSVIMIALSLIFELPKGVAVYSLNLDQIINIAYLAVVCTLLAQLCMIYGQKFTTVNQTALISSLEAVFGTFFSVLFKRETLTVMLIIGFSVVFIAMLINELKIDVLKPLIKNKSKK